MQQPKNKLWIIDLPAIIENGKVDLQSMQCFVNAVAEHAPCRVKFWAGGEQQECPSFQLLQKLVDKFFADFLGDLQTWAEEIVNLLDDDDLKPDDAEWKELCANYMEIQEQEDRAREVADALVSMIQAYGGQKTRTVSVPTPRKKVQLMPPQKKPDPAQESDVEDEDDHGLEMEGGICVSLPPPPKKQKTEESKDEGVL